MGLASETRVWIRHSISNSHIGPQNVISDTALNVIIINMYGTDILNECQVCICMHAHTTVTPFVQELDIACKNVLISHNSMMHVYACCTCNLINPCT